MTTTRVFQNGNSQALRIPTELRTNKNEYFIQKIGEVFVAYPTNDPWAPLRMTLGTFGDEMFDRDQPGWNEIPRKEAL